MGTMHRGVWALHLSAPEELSCRAPHTPLTPSPLLSHQWLLGDRLSWDNLLAPPPPPLRAGPLHSFASVPSSSFG